VQVSSEPVYGGARIAEVAPGGPAATAGLHAGALVTKLDDQVIQSGQGLLAAVQSTAPGAVTRVAFIDASGETRTVTVTLGTDQRPE
jgi:putative serine protease PepD